MNLRVGVYAQRACASPRPPRPRGRVPVSQVTVLLCRIRRGDFADLVLSLEKGCAGNGGEWANPGDPSPGVQAT